jgi:hypothetical protein
MARKYRMAEAWARANLSENKIWQYK